MQSYGLPGLHRSADVAHQSTSAIVDRARHYLHSGNGLACFGWPAVRWFSLIGSVMAVLASLDYPSQDGYVDQGQLDGPGLLEFFSYVLNHRNVEEPRAYREAQNLG